MNWLSSTPAVSPSNQGSSNNNRGTGVERTGQQTESGNSAYPASKGQSGARFGGQDQRMHYEHQRNPNFSRTGVLSPIPNEEDALLVNTVVAGNDATDRHEYTSTMKLPACHRTPFPFPTAASVKNFAFNRYTSVLSALEILKSYDLYKKQGTTTVISKGKSGNKKMQNSPLKKNFEFTKEMFMSNNSEAFIQVSHFLLETLNSEEAAHRFRDVWPIYEKKQEALYRREAHSWMKQIVLANPQFFAFVVKPEQLQGLIVNPYGERFIRFMAAFVNYVLLQVTRYEEPITDPLMENPTITKKPEVFKRQTHILDLRIKRLRAVSSEEAKKLFNLKEFSRRQIRDIIQANKQLLLYRDQVSSRVFSSIQDRRMLMDNSMLDLDVSSFIKQKMNAIPVPEFYTISMISSSLETNLNGRRDAAVDSVRTKIKAALDFIKERRRLWILLRAAIDGPKVFDLSILHNPDSDLQVILDFYAKNVRHCLKEFKCIATSDDMMTSHHNSVLKLQVIQQRCSSTGKLHELPTELKTFKKELLFEIRRLSMELQNIDWSKFSGLEDPSLSSTFHLSPTKILDSTRSTGLTPSMSSYLPTAFGVRGSTSDNTSFTSPRLYHGTNCVQHSLAVTSDTNEFSATCNYDFQSVSVAMESPVSRVPRGNKDQLECAARNSFVVSRRRSALKSKFRLSLPKPMDEIDEKDSPVRMPSIKSFVTANLLKSMSQDQEIIQSCVRISQPPMEQFPSGNNRSSSTVDQSSPLNSSSSQESPNSPDDLEQKLGIFDVTASYANYLNLSTESTVLETDF